jgi:hypothetical protein
MDCFSSGDNPPASRRAFRVSMEVFTAPEVSVVEPPRAAIFVLRLSIKETNSPMDCVRDTANPTIAFLRSKYFWIVSGSSSAASNNSFRLALSSSIVGDSLEP